MAKAKFPSGRKIKSFSEFSNETRAKKRINKITAAITSDASRSKASEDDSDLVVVELKSDEPFPGDEDGRIFVWSEFVPMEQLLTEVVGNKTIHLAARYYYRYDPPRTASTGSGEAPKGDHHLYDGNVEIAAWSDGGKARHGFRPGTTIPNKAKKALQQKFPNSHGIAGKILEELERGIALKKLLLG